MVRCLALRDQLLPHANGKRQIRQTVAVQMAKLPAADAKLDAAEPMCGRGDAWPGGDFPHDLFLNAFSHDLPYK